MSTPATIKVQGFKVAKLYKHWDGNPASTLQWLEKFNEDFALNRGDDPSYKFAQLIRSSANDAEKYHLDPSKHTGWGVLSLDEYRGQYEYILQTDGTVKVVQP